MSRRNEIQVGATVLLSLVVLIWGLAWLKEFTLTQGKTVWTVQFTESGGLAQSDEVQVNGIRKGDVRSMELHGDKVIVKLALDPDIKITHDSRVAIRNVGLMGEKVISVELRMSGTPYRTTDIIPGYYEKDLGAMMGEMGETVTAVRGLAVQLEQIAGMMSPQGKLSATIDNFRRTSEELSLVVSENRAQVRETMRNFTAASGAVKRITVGKEEQFSSAVDHFSSSAEKLDRLAGRMDSLSTVIHSMASRVQSGDGTLGRLVNDEKLYAEVNESVKSMKALIEDVKRNPRKYFKFSVF